MIDDIGGVTGKLVKVALDAALIRQEVIANNIANANTPGFLPQKLEFEKYMLQIENSLRPQNESLLSANIQNLKLILQNGETVVQTGKEKVELDIEMKNLAENSIRYQALLAGSSKRSSIIGMAISQQGGK